MVNLRAAAETVTQSFGRDRAAPRVTAVSHPAAATYADPVAIVGRGGAPPPGHARYLPLVHR